MTRLRVPFLVVLTLLLGGCATAPRPINPPITQANPRAGYRFESRQADDASKENLVVLAFSGGGTRAAAFSYGVLEFLRDTEVVGPKGKGRLLDQVDVITGVSGGSFTALAYGLYGEKLFVDYEQRFLKRDVQGEIISRTFSPANWGKLSGPAWGRSELASELYDEILFNNATFGDLNRGKGPFIMASATDISTGARFVFNQRVFDIICSDLNAVHLSRAAAASSAVPVVLSPVTINNYGGTCNATTPAFLRPFLDADNPPRPAARAIRSLRAEMAFGDGVHRPYLHLVDGGVSDNVGMRAVLDALEVLEALHEAGVKSPFDNAKRIIVFIVNSLSSPPTKWDESEAPPGTVDILLKAAGTPIDAFSYEAVELLKDTAAHWATLRRVRNSRLTRTSRIPRWPRALRVPEAEIYAIDVSFAMLKDKAELAYLNEQPHHVRAAARGGRSPARRGGEDHHDSPEFKRLLKDVGARPSPRLLQLRARRLPRNDNRGHTAGPARRHRWAVAPSSHVPAARRWLLPPCCSSVPGNGGAADAPAPRPPPPSRRRQRPSPVRIAQARQRKVAAIRSWRASRKPRHRVISRSGSARWRRSRRACRKRHGDGRVDAADRSRCAPTAGAASRCIDHRRRSRSHRPATRARRQRARSRRPTRHEGLAFLEQLVPGADPRNVRDRSTSRWNARLPAIA